MEKTNNQTELPLDLSSDTVENLDPVDLTVATALELTTESALDPLPSTSKEHTPVKPREKENEHTNGRLEEDLPEGPVDLKKRPIAIIQPTVRVVEEIATLHGESGRSETIEVITIEDSDDEEFNFRIQHITPTVTRITAPIEIITLSSDSETDEDPTRTAPIEVITLSSDSETDDDTTTEELILDAVEVEERQAEAEWEWAAYSDSEEEGEEEQATASGSGTATNTFHLLPYRDTTPPKPRGEEEEEPPTQQAPPQPPTQQAPPQPPTQQAPPQLSPTQPQWRPWEQQPLLHPQRSMPPPLMDIHPRPYARPRRTRSPTPPRYIPIGYGRPAEDPGRPRHPLIGPEEAERLRELDIREYRRTALDNYYRFLARQEERSNATSSYQREGTIPQEDFPTLLIRAAQYQRDLENDDDYSA